MVLHADELGPPILLRDKLHPRKLRCPHGARANVPHLAAPDQVMQRLHRLLDRRRRVEAVDLQEIDVVHLQALERSVDGVEDGRARKPALVGVVFELRHLGRVEDGSDLGLLAYVAVAFAEDGQLVPGQVVLFDGFGDELFGFAVGVDVGLEYLLATDAQRDIRAKMYLCPTS